MADRIPTRHVFLFSPPPAMLFPSTEHSPRPRGGLAGKGFGAEKEQFRFPVLGHHPSFGTSVSLAIKWADVIQVTGELTDIGGLQTMSFLLPLPWCRALGGVRLSPSQVGCARPRPEVERGQRHPERRGLPTHLVRKCPVARPPQVTTHEVPCCLLPGLGLQKVGCG